MANFKPDEEFIKRSQERLTRVFQEKFKQREAARQEKLAEAKVTSQVFRNLAKGDKDIAKVGEKVRQRLLDRTKQPLPDLERATSPIEAPDFTIESGGAVRSAPYDWPWTWKAHSGSASLDNVSANKDTGTMSFSGWTGEDGGSASCACAVGIFFQPKSSGALLQVFSNPSIAYEYSADRFLDGVRSHAWIGIYVGEYTLDGRFVRAAIDTQISLWEGDSDIGGFSGSNSAFGVFGTGSGDNEHFYEVWVWAGADIEGSGFGDLFDWSGASAQLSVNVPSISVFSLG